MATVFLLLHEHNYQNDYPLGASCHIMRIQCNYKICGCNAITVVSAKISLCEVADQETFKLKMIQKCKSMKTNREEIKKNKIQSNYNCHYSNNNIGGLITRGQSDTIQHSSSSNPHRKRINGKIVNRRNCN